MSFTPDEEAAITAAEARVAYLPPAETDGPPSQWGRPDHFGCFVSLSELLRTWFIEHDGKVRKPPAKSLKRYTRSRRQESVALRSLDPA